MSQFDGRYNYIHVENIDSQIADLWRELCNWMNQIYLIKS